MNKKERYFKYIVDDLVKKTEIDFDKLTYKVPFGIRRTQPLIRKEMEIAFAYINLSLKDFPNGSFFGNYVASSYGVNPGELGELLVMYYNELFRIKEEYNG